jgi:hypothetical protein
VPDDAAETEMFPDPGREHGICPRPVIQEAVNVADGATRAEVFPDPGHESESGEALDPGAIALHFQLLRFGEGLRQNLLDVIGVVVAAVISIKTWQRPRDL